ncbi:MAG: TIM barrel protein [Pseudomonadota bacterium]
MNRFSANLGFLWTDRDLPEAIHAAADAGFDAVEFHWPYDVPPNAVRAALEVKGLPLMGLNTRRGDLAAGENGLTALPGRQAEARAAIDEALAYSSEVGAASVHVMAGFAKGPEAEKAYVDGLRYACDEANKMGKTILIEPLNRHDAPGYFLETTDQAAELIASIVAPNLKLMFDCYHVGRTEGDITTRLEALLPVIGHIQIARVPDRGPPQGGEVNYAYIFEVLQGLGWSKPIGAEYKPEGATDQSLDWLNLFRAV